MRFIFCADPFSINRPDSMYEEEVSAVKGLNLEYSCISFEDLVEQHDVARAVRKVEPSVEIETGIYRGWMLKPEAYTRLYEALVERNIFLINTPSAYKHCHHLPESYAVIECSTPQSVWIKAGADVSMDEIMGILQPFGSKPIIVKDFVKSRKHEWTEACFIPSAADRQTVERVVKRFLVLQGEDLNEGLVFREFVEFEPLTTHSKSGMPLTKEYRLFFLDRQIIFSAEYWEEGDYSNVVPPVDSFLEIAKKVQSRFFTMDIARRVDGWWMIVELGDGQVAGLSGKIDLKAFYQVLAEYVERNVCD